MHSDWSLEVSSNHRSDLIAQTHSTHATNAICFWYVVKQSDGLMQAQQAQMEAKFEVDYDGEACLSQETQRAYEDIVAGMQF